MIAKLKEHFDDRINGEANVDAVLHEIEDTKEISIVQTAAELIWNDISESIAQVISSYHEMESEMECINFFPESLKHLLELLGKI